MKTDIHPEYYETTVVCSCGNTFTTRSTVESLHVELCNECHPFFTGKQKLVDSGGRVERFQKRYGKTIFTRADEEEMPSEGAQGESTPTAASTEEGPADDAPTAASTDQGPADQQPEEEAAEAEA